MLQFIGPVLKLSTVELVDSERIGILWKFIFICCSFWSCQDLIFLKDFKEAGGCRETASWRTREVREETSVIFKSLKRPVPQFKSLRTCRAQDRRKKRLEDPPWTSITREAPEKWKIPVEFWIRFSKFWAWLFYAGKNNCC